MPNSFPKWLYQLSHTAALPYWPLNLHKEKLFTRHSNLYGLSKESPVRMPLSSTTPRKKTGEKAQAPNSRAQRFSFPPWLGTNQYSEIKFWLLYNDLLWPWTSRRVWGSEQREKRGRDRHESLVLDDYSIHTGKQHWVGLGETIRRLTSYSCFVAEDIQIRCLESLSQRCILQHSQSDGNALSRGSGMKLCTRTYPAKEVKNSQWRNQEFIHTASLITKGNTLRYFIVLQAPTCQWYKLDRMVAARDHLSSFMLLRREIFWHHISSTIKCTLLVLEVTTTTKKFF